jgi:general secretion pathway protein A
MYREYFGLKDNPFSIAPDPHYFYMSEGHQEALAHLVYGVNCDGGFVLLTGEVGTGKTTVCRCLLDQVPENAEIAFILNPRLTVEELLATICDEFGIAYPEGNMSNKIFVSAINDYLLNLHTKGQRAILIIEEAQNLSVEVLEQIRLLTNLETSQRKLLQIIMLGQPELKGILSRPELRQLTQRVTARYHLGPLSKEDVSAYVDHRLAVAGLVRGKLFPKHVLTRLFRLSGGIPRLINVICDRALIGAFVQGKDLVDMKTLITAAREVSGEENRWWHRKKVLQGILAGLVIVSCSAAAGVYYFQKSGYGQKPRVQLAGARSETSQRNRTVPGIDKRESVPPEKAQDGALSITRDQALKVLFGKWQIQYDPAKGQNPCEQARTQGLGCIEEKGGLSSLRQMNKPAILTLLSEKGEPQYGALVSLEGDRATFSIGPGTRSVNIKDIAPRWSGDFLALWRMPRGYTGELRPGSRGPFVAWLDQQLAIAQGQTANQDLKTIYDDFMVRQVREFQAATGLVPDGIVGTKTIICLADAAGTGGPTLAERKGKN